MCAGRLGDSSCGPLRYLPPCLCVSYPFRPPTPGALLPSMGIALNPSAAAAMMAFSSVAVVSNSLLLRAGQQQGGGQQEGQQQEGQGKGMEAAVAGKQ